jgi:DNA-binding HxlR family transcriptional regulator
MKSYGQYCPLAHAMEILGDRWTVLVVRDLLTGVRRFNDLARGLPRMSRSLLSKRLGRLQDAGLIEHVEHADGTQEYVPTAAGEALWPALEALLSWGAKWAFDEPSAEELDPKLLIWWIHRGVARDRVPSDKTTIQFDFDDIADPREGRYWLVCSREDVSVCQDPPRLDVDVWVKATTSTVYKVWVGRLPYERAVATRALRVKSLPKLERAFPTWFEWSPGAPAVRAAMNDNK